MKTTGVKELSPDTNKLNDMTGPKYTLGYRFDGIPFDHPALTERRQLVKKDLSQPEFRYLPGTIGKSPGVKFNPPRSSSAINTSRLLMNRLGPGSYNPIIKEKIQSHIMVKTQERPQTTLRVPGPGKYKPEDAFNYIHQSMSKTISTRTNAHKEGMGRCTPGPGSYQTDVIKQICGPKLVMGTTKKKSPERKKVFLKQYERIMKPQKVIQTFGKSLRKDFAPKFVTPGPDEYQKISHDKQKDKVNETTDKESCKFGIKTAKLSFVNKNPGPGTYYIKDSTYDGLYYSVGKALRGNYGNTYYADRFYNTRNLFTSPIISFTTEVRRIELKKSKYPGPGTYNVPDTVGIIPEYLLNGRIDK